MLVLTAKRKGYPHDMQDKKVFLIPLVFIAVLIPVMIAALFLFRPDDTDAECDCSDVLPAFAPHSHGMALARENRDALQLLFNVVNAAEVYDVVDGRLQPAGEPDPAMKHVTVDVLDAEIALGERLPVSVQIVVRDAETGETVIDDDAPAMYAPGHGYHFGDNYPLAHGTDYEWHVTISPVQALRMAGLEDRWLEPIEWEGSFSLDEEGNVVGKPMMMEMIGEYSKQGIHVIVNAHHAETLYEVHDGEAHPVGAETMAHDHTNMTMDNTRYFAVDVTDHAVNYEEKLVGADVTLTFSQGDTSFDVALQSVISPVMGYHYGANVTLDPGEWTITATVSGLDFQRHAGAAVSLPLGAVSGDFTYTVAEAASG